jgi:hypothetical protein
MARPEETIENLRRTIAEPLSIIADSEAGQFLGAAIEEFEDLAIALACIHLFERADEEGYARNIQLCGFARHHFLQRTATMEIDDVHSAASRAQGDLAAFIAGDDALLWEIVSLTEAEPHAGEYEDDFRYRMILHYLMVAPAQIDGGALAVLIDRFESARNGAETTRSALCGAFQDLDEEGFWSAFQNLHQEVEEQRASPPQTDDPWPELSRRLWLEGLVWLALVRRIRGWSSREGDYSLCPSWGFRRELPPAGENIFSVLPLRE